MSQYTLKDFINEVFAIKKLVRAIPGFPILNDLDISRRLHELELSALSLGKAISDNQPEEEIKKLGEAVAGRLLILQSLSIISDKELDHLLDRLDLVAGKDMGLNC